ncbi:hypothetical protein BG74_05560 [Sodalis-like endosymbiont of Proechinophthirus fluctus]|nr:hypothetical protein BG74_05560 [Sodalis-like endosymbiont of Proechinophthirus fluctus]
MFFFNTRGIYVLILVFLRRFNLIFLTILSAIFQAISYAGNERNNIQRTIYGCCNDMLILYVLGEILKRD